MFDFFKKLFGKEEPIISTDIPVESIGNIEESPAENESEPVQEIAEPVIQEEPVTTIAEPIIPASIKPPVEEKVIRPPVSAFPVGNIPTPNKGEIIDTNKAKLTSNLPNNKKKVTLHGPMKANLPGQPNVGTNEINAGAINVGSNSGSAFISVVNGHYEFRNHPDNQGSYVRLKAGTPLKYNDLTTKAYVDAVTSGYSIQDTIVAASTGSNVALSTNLENGDSLDQKIIFQGELVLLKDQTDPTQNGVYIINWNGSPSRYPAAGMLNNNLFYIAQGKINHESFFKVTGTFTGTGGQPNYGVDAINFVPVTMHPGGGGNVSISGTNHVVVTNPSAGSYQIGLDNSGVTAGTYNTLVVDQNGIVTFGTNVPYTGSGTVTQVNTGTGLTGGPITTTGTIEMDVSGVTAGTYGNGSNIPQITVDALGRILSATNVSIPPQFSWNNVAGTTQLMSPNNGYITSNPALTQITLPTTIPQGAIVAIAGANAGGWQLKQNSGQTVHFGNLNTTTGTSGMIASTYQFDYIELLCVIANTDFIVKASVGNLSVT